MHVFVDESGNFTPPPDPRPHVCCVATLAVPDSVLPTLVVLQKQLLADWKLPERELKGRDLNERKFERVFTALGNRDVVPSLVAIDMGLHSDAQIAEHKGRQAAKLRDSVAGPEYLQSFRDEVHELASRLERLSNQLYVQAIAQTEAIARTMRIATLRFAQSEPTALSSFVWRVDAKGKTIQECERLWTDLAKPMLQTIFLERPFLTVEGEGFDYSAMTPFENPVRNAPPEHLVAARPEGFAGPFHSHDLRKLIADLAFQDSRSCEGIQFADLVASAFCRACNGHLEERGWRRLGRLLVRHPGERWAVQYRSLTPLAEPARPPSLPYGDILKQIEAGARDFLVAGDPHERRG